MPDLSVCKSCGAPIVRMPIGDNGGSIPVNAYTVRDGDETYDDEQHEHHMVTCPMASSHRSNQNNFGLRNNF